MGETTETHQWWVFRPIVQLNNKPFQKLPGCRASVFAQIDAPALRSLPMQTWELAVFKTVKVHIDQHIEFEGHRYSVPHALVGVTLEVRVTQRTVEILHRGQRVASHMRCAHKGGFTTVPEHLSAAHRAHLQWSAMVPLHVDSTAWGVHRHGLQGLRLDSELTPFCFTHLVTSTNSLKLAPSLACSRFMRRQLPEIGSLQGAGG